MQATLFEPERANLLAIILHRLLSRSDVPLRPGSYRIHAGGMTARILQERDTRVESGEGEADCSIEGTFPAFIDVALGGSAVRAFLGGRVRMNGSPFRALALLKVLRCKN